MSGEVNVIPTLREIRGGASPSKFGGGQSRDIFRGGPVKKITLYKPIEWSNDKEEVCRFKKDKKCIQKSEEVLDNILMIDFETLPHVHCAVVHGGAGN